MLFRSPSSQAFNHRFNFGSHLFVFISAGHWEVVVIFHGGTGTFFPGSEPEGDAFNKAEWGGRYPSSFYLVSSRSGDSVQGS
ncbi:unnamed protein product [Agarophyton chilense]